MRITKISRLQNSWAGNPRYRIWFDNGTSAVTKINGGFAYAITSGYVGKEASVTYFSAKQKTITGLDLI